MSEYQEYDTSLLQFTAWNADTETWDEWSCARVTVTKSYDVHENGTLVLAPEKASFTVKTYEGVERDAFGMYLEREVRVKYGEYFSFDGYIDQLFWDWETEEEGHTTFRFTAAGRDAYVLSPMIKLENALPQEPATQRLRRYLWTVHAEPAVADDYGTFPPEEKGSEFTVFDLIREYQAVVGRPGWMPATDWLELIPEELGLPTGYLASEWEEMYASGSASESAGGKAISFDPGDKINSITASLKDGDARLLLTDWRPGQKMVMPWLAPYYAPVKGYTVTLTQDTCSTELDFYVKPANVRAPGPPAARWTPGAITTPLTGGKPWNEYTSYPPGAVVSHDGHLWRAPTTLPAGVVPGVVIPAYTNVTLTDTYYGTGLPFYAVATSSVATDGTITFRLQITPGQPSGRSTPLMFLATGGSDVALVMSSTGFATPSIPPMEDTFDPDGIYWDTDHDGYGDTTIPGHFTGLVLRQGTDADPGSALTGPIVATYPFGNATDGAAPTWLLMM